jgi:hypothetical protein
MRRLLLAAAALVVAASTVPRAYAQIDPGGDQQQQDDDAKKKKRDQDWGDKQAPLPAMRNAGPCPFVKTLYDAARYIEFKQGKEASADVGYTGEIQGVSAACAYKSDQPITVNMQILFELGHGPQAAGNQKTYHYWVAVTDRNREVLAKQTFDLPVTFPAGQDRLYRTETIKQIVIPRATPTVSGANFEVLVGFEVTPEMAAFNRDGKRFRPNVGGTTVAAQDSSQNR